MCQKRISKSICDLNTVGKIVGGYILIKMNYENSKLSVQILVYFKSLYLFKVSQRLFTKTLFYFHIQRNVKLAI